MYNSTPLDLTVTCHDTLASGDTRTTGDTLTLDDLGDLLTIWAHPDDETYLCGGLMAAAIDAGREVTVITATDGEAGFADADAWPAERASWVRHCEAAAAMGALGVADQRWLGYPDGGCDRIDPTTAVARLTRLIDDISPDTIVTFGPDGSTGHPDHIAVHQWVTAAVAALAAPPRVLHSTTHQAFVDRFAELHERFDVFLDPALPAVTPDEQISLRVRLDGPALDRKLVALRALATQTAPVIAAFGEQDYREWVAEEVFVEAP